MSCGQPHTEATSDYSSNKLEFPDLQYGPGDVALAHGPNEMVPVDDIATTARGLALMALDVCGVAV